MLNYNVGAKRSASPPFRATRLCSNLNDSGLEPDRWRPAHALKDRFQENSARVRQDAFDLLAFMPKIKIRSGLFPTNFLSLLSMILDRGESLPKNSGAVQRKR
jgi:hypothetical protein